MDYISLRINIANSTEDITDLLAAFLCDVGYESFEPDSEGLTAYIQSEKFNIDDVNEILSNFPISIEASAEPTFVKGENWNEEWEKHYFQPILIGGKVAVHSSFHTDIPKAEYDILIDPKMAFGTGHHSTTSLMMRGILASDVKGKTVIDMGTGTGILAILCGMCGASEIIGIEIDPGAFDNALENAALNHSEVNFILGDASKLADVPMADLFLANINRNVITNDIKTYASKLKQGGTMLLSGFYVEDIPIVEKAASEAGLAKVSAEEDNRWACLRLKRL